MEKAQKANDKPFKPSIISLSPTQAQIKPE
jgi:hypothetical protein